MRNAQDILKVLMWLDNQPKITNYEKHPQLDYRKHLIDNVVGATITFNDYVMFETRKGTQLHAINREELLKNKEMYKNSCVELAYIDIHGREELYAEIKEK